MHINGGVEVEIEVEVETEAMEKTRPDPAYILARDQTAKQRTSKRISS
jgi:hypothetical protein